MTKKHTQKQGFGLIEVLISATIIAIMLGALISVGRMGLSSTQHLLARSQATFLAQEGLELARQTRDTAWTDGNGDTYWDGFGNNGSTSILNIINNNNGGSPVNGWFVFTDHYRWTWQDGSAWEEPITVEGINFKRKIVFSRVDTSLLPNGVAPDKNAVKAVATVCWDTCDAANSITSSELITNWRPNF